MQRVVKIVILLLFILGVYYAFKVALPYLNKREIMLQNGVAQKKEYHVIKVFTLKSNILRFDIPNFSDYIKFIFTPNISSKSSTLESISNLYTTIEYTLYSGKKVIDTKSFTFKSNYVQYIDDNGTIVKPIEYSNSNLLPTSSTELKINLNRYKRVTHIILKLLSKDKDIVDISVRGYYLERNSKEKIKKIWGHMPIEKKKILFSDNVYPLYYISKIERDIRLQALWKPNAPVGIVGKSYKVRNMLKRKDLNGISPVVYIKPIIYSDSNITATRFLDRGRYKIYIKDAKNDKANIEVSLYSENRLYMDRNYTLSLFRKEPLELNIGFPSILALKSNSPISYSIVDLDKNQTLYLPAKSSLYYKIDSNRSIEYKLLQTQDRVVKIECRSINFDINTTLKILLKDAQDRVIKVIDKNVSFIKSEYDYIGNFQVVSKPIYMILPLPDSVSSISLSSSSPLFTKLYSRNLKIPYPIYSYKSYLDSESKIPAWFRLRPYQFSLAYIKSLTEYIYKQIKPPKVSIYTKEGLYRYTTIYPKNSLWQGYTILQKRPKDINYIRNSSWGSIYALVESGDNITLHSEVNDIYVKPKVIIIQKKPILKEISISIDGVKVLHTTIDAKVQEFILSPLSTNKPHKVTISDSNISLFISNSAILDKTFIKKSFILLNKPLYFDIEKVNEANETLKVEFAIEDSNLYKSMLDIDGNISTSMRVFNNFTFNSYALFFKPNNNIGYILNDNGSDVNISQAIYIPLADNLREGNYSLSLYPYRYNKRIFVNLSLIRLGEEEDIIIRREY